MDGFKYPQKEGFHFLLRRDLEGRSEETSLPPVQGDKGAF